MSTNQQSTPCRFLSIPLAIALLVGAFCARADDDCFIFPDRSPASSDDPGKVSGATSHLDPRIIPALHQVATNHHIHIHITSGYRDPDQQAKAMYDYWLRLKRGGVYSTNTLPVASRQKLDEYYRATNEVAFLSLAKSTVGGKSKHTKQIAVDLKKVDSAAALTALGATFKEVKEGNRTDIQHFELKQP